MLQPALEEREWVEQKSMTPSVAYLWLHQTQSWIRNWPPTGEGGDEGGGLVMKSDRLLRER